jgi:hypothetical protein
MPKRRARSRQGMQLDESAEPRNHLPDDECMHLVRAVGGRAVIDVSLQGCSYSGESPELWRPKTTRPGPLPLHATWSRQ